MRRPRLRLLLRWLRWLPGIVWSGPRSRRTTADLFERRARSRPDGVFVRFEGREIRWSEHGAAANRVAHWALEKGLGRGDVVALLMENRPEHLVVWTGLAKVGVTTALLDTNLSGKALAHVLRAASCRALVLGDECIPAFATLDPAHVPEEGVYVAAEPGREPAPLPPGAKPFDEAIAGYSPFDPPRSVRAGLRGGDPLFYIYTSGTTGLPKAARFSHARFAGGGLYALLSGFRRGDVMYCALPLHHTVGGVMCVNAVLRAGGTLALARRFRASAFWREAVEMRATAFQYVGEICRYLLAQPHSPWEEQHQIRLCVGNGLRPDVWGRFQERFRIPHVCEFYGATESNVALVNLEGRPGSVGRPVPGTAVALVRYDPDAEAPMRSPTGRCIPCEAGEAGELLGRISRGRTAAGSFEGYTSKPETEKKILRDVFAPGDAWFRTGDLLRRDADGFYSFVDRIGDTFRWKGENVSTQEVADAVARFPGVALCAAYGVAIPGADGRAGMAALVLDRDAPLDGGALWTHLQQALPHYARPAFLRVQARPDLTGTFKLRKVELRREGFDPTRMGDPPDRLLFRDDRAQAYRPLEPEVQRMIEVGALRF